MAKKMKVQIWSSIVNVLVIEGKHLKDKEGDPLSKPYLRIRSVEFWNLKNAQNVDLLFAPPQQAERRKVQDQVGDAQFLLD